MKFLALLLVSAVAFDSSSATFSSGKRLLETSAHKTNNVVSSLLTPGAGSHGNEENYDIHISRKPVCTNCRASESPVVTVPASPAQAKTGRAFYYPQSYFYPPTAYYYHPQPYYPASRRVASPYSQGSYFVYPHDYQVQPHHNNVRQVVASGSHVQPKVYAFPGAYQPYAAVPAVPNFSQIVRQKSGRPFVAPVYRRPGMTGFKGGDSQVTEPPTKGGATPTTEAPVQPSEPIEQQQTEEQIPVEEVPVEQAPAKGFYSHYY